MPNEALSLEALQAIEGSKFDKKANENVTAIEEVKLKGKKQSPTEN